MFSNTAFASAIQEVIDNGKPAPDHTVSRRIKGSSKLSIQEHFEIFSHDNPIILDLLIAGAYEAVNEGHKKFGIAFIFERIRWKLPIHTYSTDFKLNNNYRSRYVRLIEEREPGLRGFFRVRALRSL